MVENRYDIETDIVTITVDRCPTRQQNFEYAQYLLAALYHESFITEPWESTKVEADMEYYDWNTNQSKESLEKIMTWRNPKDRSIAAATDAVGKSVKAILQWDKSKDEPIPAFGKSVEAIFNEGENEANLQTYKEETLKVLGLSN